MGVKALRDNPNYPFTIHVFLLYTSMQSTYFVSFRIGLNEESKSFVANIQIRLRASGFAMAAPH